MRSRDLRIPTPHDEKLDITFSDRFFFILAVALPFILYALGAARVECDWDAGERDLAMIYLGLSHPPGSPLHALIGHVFLMIFRGASEDTVRLLVNLFSSICGALASGVIFLILRNFTERKTVAFWAALAVATSVLPWSQSVYSEVYSLHYLLFALFMFYFVRWLKIGNPRFLFLAAFLYSLSLGAHMSTSLVAPGILAYILLERPRTFLRPKWVAGAILFLLLGLSWIFYLYIRGQTALLIGATQRPDTWTSMVDYISGRQYFDIGKNYLPASNDVWLLLGKRTVLGLGLMLYGSLIAGFLFMVRGMFAGFLRERGLTVMGWISIAAYFLYFGTRITMDFGTLLLPLYIFLAVFLVIGLEQWTESQVQKGEIMARTYRYAPMFLCGLMASQIVVFTTVSLVYQFFAPVESHESRQRFFTS